MRRDYIDTPEGQLHYASEGDGPALLLLHYTGASLEFYRPLLSLLAKTRRVIAVDTPGFGCSDPPTKALYVEEYAERIVDFADRLGLEVFNIFGSNTGAAIGLEIALSRPERVERLGLMAMPYFTTPEVRAQALAQLTRNIPLSPDGSELIARWDMFMGWWRWEVERHPGVIDSEGAMAQAAGYIADFLRSGRSFTDGQRAAYSYDASAKLGSIRAPTLVIGFEGENDPDLSYTEYLRQSAVFAPLVPGSTFVCLPGSSSVTVMLGNLHRLAAILDGFFTSEVRP